MNFFDFGSVEKNRLAYGQSKQPLYDLSRVRLRNLSVWTGNTDRLVRWGDIQAIIEKLEG